MNCQDVRTELTAYTSGELSKSERQKVDAHLQGCPFCRRELELLESTRDVLKSWDDTEPPSDLAARLEARLSEEASGKRPVIHFRLPSLKWAYVLFTAACLTASVYFGLHFFLSHGETPTEVAAPGDIQVGFYIAEHDSALRQVSFQRTPLPSRAPFWIPLNREDLLYYDTVSGESEEGQSGVFLKSGRRWEKGADDEGTEISDGEILSLAEVQEAVSFHIVAPAILSEDYRLASIRKVSDKECVQLVYSSGTSTISLFQQPMIPEMNLSRADFREYILRLSKDKKRTAVLGWHTDQVIFNLVAEMNLSDLIKVADEIQERRITDGLRQYYEKLYE